MNLPEALVYADIDHLHRIARHYQISESPNSKNHLIQTILQLILDQRSVEKQVHSLSTPEERFLLLLLLDNRNRFTIEDLLAKASQAVKMEGCDEGQHSSRSIVSQLMNCGWVFIDRNQKYPYYCIPDDLKIRLVRALKHNNAYVSDDTIPITYQYNDDKNDIVSDLCAILHFVAKELVYLTTEGVIHKRQQHELFKQLAVSEAPIEGKQWRFGYGRRFPNYPNRFALLYDYLFYLGCIEEKENQLLITTEGEKHLQGELQLSVTDCYQFWRKLYRKPIRNIDQIIALLDLYCNTWCEQEHLIQKVVDFVQPFYFDSKHDVLQKRIIEPLTWFGMLMIRDEGGKSFIKSYITDIK